jgi:hypothetical protein
MAHILAYLASRRPEHGEVALLAPQKRVTLDHVNQGCETTPRAGVFT